MKTEKILDSTLIAFLDKYSDMQDSVGTNLMNSIKKAKDAEVIIPVLGMQGMGKSTLINGLLKENIPYLKIIMQNAPPILLILMERKVLIHLK